ncbi:phosphatidate cytidylyltransferase [Quisquiliibacterium transsilvanicum]|uniref:Phosphatidate cytidylyltransferase n=1 Tax=Quisquiliibacterium transsilvanicum TaxID=1549638 RepID=A0A7W8HEN0_9BURK|nr:phosphatidate cytidylyltransferase [Quisquiliibacterium transsilvanicum]MBB5270513.1 phosphatidate cytidylyltransferase [Quisquiliibacterium transsilvanicum]
MLGPRVITALVLLAVLLPAIFVFPPLVWGVLTLAFLAVAAWEWVRLLPARAGGPAGAGAGLAAGAVLVAGAAALAWREHAPWPPMLVAVACLLLLAFWVFAAPTRLARHEARSGGAPLAAALLFGCWCALYELRLLGPVPLLSSMAVIWVADIAAYFFGRALGRRKLAPSISPGKSWEGAVGGFFAVAVAGLLAAGAPALQNSLPALLVQRTGPVLAVAALVAIAALSIVGDLHESLLKREAGVKDSGWILPGHGGMLDRIDALIPTMPAALLLYQLLR